ncbi:MAG: hypothetical protein E6I18_03875 [Chloroflexi bacterium]|nr:MAG: hypothetical protein E6I18_03875 [Chloroflexota bacterium]
MRTAAALDDVLASRSHIRILRALDAIPEGLGMSVRDLARRAGVTHPRASEVLSSLAQLGVTSRQRAGRADLYQLNRAHLLYGLVHELFRQEAEVDAELRRYLRTRLPVVVKGVQEAYLFGSFARGEAHSGSDIDLAVVVSPSSAPAAEAASLDLADEVRRRFGSDLSVHFSTKPLRRRVQGGAGRDLWSRIAKEGIRILPPQDESAHA